MSAPASVIEEAAWASPEVEDRIRQTHPEWRRHDGACPACVQQALLVTLLDRGESAFQDGIQGAWPLDAEAAFGAIPTPLRMRADPRFTGRGVTIAFVDSGFFPHPDLVTPRNRIRAWVDAAGESVTTLRFERGRTPRWPDWNARADHQWHGLMTSTTATGNGSLSHSLYRGMASDADIVLVQARGSDGRIDNARIARALRWLATHGPDLGVRVVNVSLGGDPTDGPNAVDDAIHALSELGIMVIAAAGNDGVRHLVPPASSPFAFTVGGLDDRNTLADADNEIWHGNYGETVAGVSKPEIVAPSIWVVAPVMPGSTASKEAHRLFRGRAQGNRDVERRIGELKLVTPHYQHVEGTSFAAPIASSIVACMLEANAALKPGRIRELLQEAACPVPGASGERQGAGALDAGRAIALALGEHHSAQADYLVSPALRDGIVRFLLHDHRATEVSVVGSWRGWQAPGEAAVPIEPGLWEARVTGLAPGSYEYKLVVDGRVWLADPANPTRRSDGFGGMNSVFVKQP